MLSKFKIDFKKLKEIDKVMLFSMIALMIFGIINIYLASSAEYGTLFLKRQSLWFIVCLVALYFVVAIDYTLLKSYTPLFYWGSILLLIVTIFIGTDINGARGWIRLGPLSFQPSELAKMATIMMLGKTLEEMNGTINEWKNFLTMAFYAIVPAVFIVIQPDMGMTMVLFFIVVGIFFIGGLDLKIIGGGLLSLLLVVIIVWNSGVIQPYQKKRITSFMNPESDTSESGYQLRQSLISIGNGGAFGLKGSATKDKTVGYAAQYVPEVQTDFIFASIGEQWGLAGAAFLLLLYGLLISKMIAIGRTAKDTFGSIICVGLVAYFLFALLQNIGMTIGLMPITGITLPLLSYGGTSLLTTVMSIGLVLNVGMRRKKIYF
ncbi:rod shape-determining protein RodA [Clostridium tertium]|jgi:rod shape determining protein RodA|uniref:Rod shape-determining protein RodA n=1 Tax=Clostridium tertium TaxID=1559 RepID=A0A9X3XM97_9CLOT|nr:MULTISPECIES: rod shape-determining protein RodA [Clostridium]EEH99172.1 rod shape-determining protein RodA [Clostridium sp. 7_2_43FAA]MBU6136746.1 rod shape-determining protein RodA [Clostridium tertium]MDB1939542.1 rod shape-determining protein RodA [Clostridium tertium]MDB1955601.1 rod shape-determining protein RodA [Clostridium tertium]MDB1957010.1 rod shape-determining protein RodA [Clostridium tertium]